MGVPSANTYTNFDVKSGLRPDFTSKLVHVLAFGTPKFYIVPYDKIKHKLVNLSSNCDVKSGLIRINERSLVWIIVRQGSTVLAVGAGGGAWPFFSYLSSEMTRYRLKY